MTNISGGSVRLVLLHTK